MSCLLIPHFKRQNHWCPCLFFTFHVPFCQINIYFTFCPEVATKSPWFIHRLNHVSNIVTPGPITRCSQHEVPMEFLNIDTFSFASCMNYGFIMHSALLCIPSPTTDPWSFHWMLLFFLHYLLLSLVLPKPVFSIKSYFSPGESIPIFPPSFCSKLYWLPSRPAKQLSCCNFLPTANRSLDWNHRFLDPTNSILFYSVFKYH